jgi:hypothetical protein
VLDIGREKNSGDVVIMSLEVSNWHELGFFAVLKEVPDIDASLYVGQWLPSKSSEKSYRIGASAESRTITCNCNTGDWCVLFGNQLVGAIVLSQVPNTNTSSTITANNLALVGMNDHIIDRAAVRVASLNGTTSSLPDLDKAILRARDHPFSFTMERDTRDIASMTFKGEERIGVG